MNTKLLRALVVSVALCLGWSAAWPAESGAPYPANATFTTVAITPLAIEGLTIDATGNFYTTGRQTAANKKCPVWRIGQNGSRKSVGFIPNSPACNPSGIAFDAVGSLYIADGGMAASIWKVVPDSVGCASDESDHPLCAAIAASNASSPTAAFATGSRERTASHLIRPAISGRGME